MSEIEQEIAEIDRQINALNEDRAALLRAASIMKLRAARLSGSSNSTITGPLLPVAISIADAAERVLRHAGKSLHIGAIHERMAVMGKHAAKQSVVSTLLRYPERFIAYGRNTFGLKQFPTPKQPDDGGENAAS